MYCAPGTHKAELGIASSDTADDTTLLRKLVNSSRWVDNYCKRRFYVKIETRYFTALRSAGMLLPDLLSITTLKTDADGDRTYEDSWAATDYDLLPFNAWPKWEIGRTPDGDYSFPANVARGIEIAGSWGYGNGESATPYEDSTTTTNEELDASETTVTVTSGAVLAVGQTILVESEQMYVTAKSTNDLTVVRGVNGTTAATHATSKTVYVYRYPGPIQEACLIQASRLFRRKDAPFGMVGSPEMGYSAIIGRLDPDIALAINDYRNLGVP